jgi:hypothetical protein
MRRGGCWRLRGAGGGGPQERCRDLRHGPVDAARLGSPLQRRRAGGAVEPSLGWAVAAVER